MLTTRRGETNSFPRNFQKLVHLLGTIPSYDHFAPLPKIVQQGDNSWLRFYDVSKTLYTFYKTHRCKSRYFFGVQRMSCPNIPNLPEKPSCAKLSLCKLSAAVATLCFHLPCCHRKMQNMVLINPIEKSTLGYARTLSEASWFSIREDLPHSFEIFHSHSSCCCHQGTTDLVELSLKLLPSLNTYMWYSVS